MKCDFFFEDNTDAVIPEERYSRGMGGDRDMHG